MKRGVFFCVGQNIQDKSSGIGKKITTQHRVLVEKFEDVKLVNVDNEATLFDKMFFWCSLVPTPYKNRQVKAISSISIKDLDFIYIRKPTTTTALIHIIKLLRTENADLKIVMELPTYPSNEYRGIKRILSFFSSWQASRYRKYINRILTYSDDEIIWGINTIRTSNCIDCNEVRARNPINVAYNQINLIAVADFNYWHGYDRVIEGLIKYKHNPLTVYNVHLYLVGEGPELQRYKTLVRAGHVNDIVHFLGKKSGQDLDQIFDMCCIGLDAMGRHRSGVYYNSSLKGKEYGARGLPIVSGVKTELDAFPEYKYYFRVPANDDAIDVSAVIDFYKAVYKYCECETGVIQNIRSFTQEHFSYDFGYKELLEYLDK